MITEATRSTVSCASYVWTSKQLKTILQNIHRVL